MNKQSDTDSISTRNERHEGLEALSQALRFSIVFLYALALVMILVIGSQSFMIVKQHEVGLIYRFGKLRAVVGTGLHLIWPYPIEESTTLEVSRAKRVSSESFLATPGETIPASLRPGFDGFLLTADKNIIHAKCVLTYYVNSENQTDVLNFFVRRVTNEEELKALLDNAVLKAAAAMTADTILFEVEKFRDKVASNLRKSVVDSHLGIRFDTKDISISTSPPAQTKGAFNALNQASQRQEQLKNEARGYKVKTENEARSKAEGVIAQANSERIRKLSTAKADASTFVQLLEQYQKHPKLIRKTLYEESMFRVFESVQEKFVVREKSKSEVRVLLNRNMENTKDRNRKK